MIKTSCASLAVEGGEVRVGAAVATGWGAQLIRKMIESKIEVRFIERII